ncbi:MAG: RpoL/Rpb11 RNA polymerase subunit family protein [Candidatus ainarchaeum sp.]|nr:RpoL/Rpb11 RNA polymerase subunit family protein [Candidatus ainarchaeum sp.]
MEIEILTNEGKKLEFYLNGERHTIPNVLREKLAENENVEFVAYRLEHPLDKKARFILTTNSSNPKKVLIEAIKELQSEVSELKKEFAKIK